MSTLCWHERPLLSLSLSRRFVDALVRGLDGLLSARAAAVCAAAAQLVDAFYAPLSKCVRRRLQLPGGGAPARVDVAVDGGELADGLALEFLLRGVPDAGGAAGLVEEAAAGLKAAGDWTESCAERRAELARRLRVLDQARAGIQRLLAGGGAAVVKSESEGSSASEPAARKPRRA